MRVATTLRSDLADRLAMINDMLVAAEQEPYALEAMIDVAVSGFLDGVAQELESG